ncbi:MULTISPECIES: transposase [Amniculibacterium]|uniref:transposase n=1 Tax=Amniculibacterium TaxID=2715289 RepID=UPI000F5A7034|nr:MULTISPECIES: transposase [Amniculibacterium]
MTLFKNKYRIESFRLKNWDYRNPGAYFITICTKNREHYFGEIVDGEMQLNENGIIAHNFWADIPEHFAHVRLGEFVVMPNHVHGIILLVDSVKSLQCNDSTGQYNDSTNQCNDSTNQCNNPTESTNPNQFMSDISPKPGSVSTIIRSYKSACTKQIHIDYPELDFGWQSKFHDHIIRNHDEYIRIENYIINNPKNWKEDKFHKP